MEGWWEGNISDDHSSAELARSFPPAAPFFSPEVELEDGLAQAERVCVCVCVCGDGWVGGVGACVWGDHLL